MWSRAAELTTGLQAIFTVLFWGLGESQLHGATVRVIPLTHSTLVLLFVRADLLVAADVLRGGEKKSGDKSVKSAWLLHRLRWLRWENYAIRTHCRRTGSEPDDGACWKHTRTKKTKQNGRAVKAPSSWSATKKSLFFNVGDEHGDEIMSARVCVGAEMTFIYRLLIKYLHSSIRGHCLHHQNTL